MNEKGMTGILLGVSIALAPAGSINGQDRKLSEPSKATAPTPKSAQETVEQSVAKLADQLKRHPVEPKESSEHRHGIYLLDLRYGDVTLIADQPAPGLTNWALNRSGRTTAAGSSSKPRPTWIIPRADCGRSKPAKAGRLWRTWPPAAAPHSRRQDDRIAVHFR